jgi:hypothetical protein
VNRRDIQAFIERDWGRIAAAKDAHWLERKRRLGLAEGLRIAEELRRQVRLVRPEFPTPEDRAADLACHIRVSELLRRVAAKRRR